MRGRIRFCRLLFGRKTETLRIRLIEEVLAVVHALIVGNADGEPADALAGRGVRVAVIAAGLLYRLDCPQSVSIKVLATHV